ncbi:MAG: hypothetical protein ACFFCD_09885 [Promethearchaeota archaeon]
MAGILRRGKKKKEEDEERTEEELEEAEETVERFPRAEEFRKPAQDTWNALPKMRQPIHVKFIFLAMALMLIRPWNQKYDVYTPFQLAVLEDLLNTELEAIREAYRRKIPKE